MSEEIKPYQGMSAEVYDALYEWKNYEQESERLKELISENKQSEGNTLLDFACGTGVHLGYLIDKYEVEGVDLSEQQLEVARKRLPEVSFRQGDMRDFDAGETFDVVTCLFSSIGYLYPRAEMQKGISNMAKHLKPGGVLFVEPWLAPDKFEVGHVSTNLNTNDPKLHVVRMGFGEIKDGNVSVLNMHHLVGRPEGVDYFKEKHEMGLYKDEEYKAAFEKVGLQVKLDEKGLMDRGLYISTKPLS